jgi:hypothetical protein
MDSSSTLNSLLVGRKRPGRSTGCRHEEYIGVHLGRPSRALARVRELAEKLQKAGVLRNLSNALELGDRARFR